MKSKRCNCQLGDTSEDLQSDRIQSAYTYQDVKKMAFDYQVAKEKFYQHYEKVVGSTWIKKPPEQDQFKLWHSSEVYWFHVHFLNKFEELFVTMRSYY